MMLNSRPLHAMRIVRASLSLVLLLTAATGLAPAAWADHVRSGVGVSMSVDVGFFYERLSPYGEWVEEPAGAWVWVPRVSHDWRPYTAGHWVWTDDCGWMWVSDERFGWAVYHYGRWRYTPAYGWAWSPGYEWAPAWVAWRYGDDYVGWAPLPPDATWSMSVGLRAGVAELDAGIEPRAYTFVPVRSFADPSLGRHVMPVQRNVEFVRVTRNETRYSLVGQRVVNRGIEPQRLERAGGRRVPRARIAEVASVEAVSRGAGKGELPVFRPRVTPGAAKVPPHGRREARRQQPDDREQRRSAEAARAEREQRRSAEADDRRLRALEKQREADERSAHARQQERLRHEYETQRQADRRQADERRAETKRQEREQRELEQRRQAEQREVERRVARDRQQHEQDRKRLARGQARERDSMERQHGREIKHPPLGTGSDSLEARHEKEHREIEERQARERRNLEGARERAQQERAAAERGERRGREARGGDERRPEPRKKAEPKGRPKGSEDKKKPG